MREHQQILPVGWRTERPIQAAQAPAGRTLIAHRRSTVVDAYQILVLERGQVIEQNRDRSCWRVTASTPQMWARQQEAPAA